MNLREGIEKYGSRMHLALMAILKDQFGIDIDKTKAQDISNSLALSDVLALDSALDDNDLEKAGQILQIDTLSEYSLPGRGNVQSRASSRNERNRNSNQTATGGDSDITSTSVTTSNDSYTSQGTKPVAGGAKTSTGQGSGATTTAQDQEIADKEKELDDLKKKAGVK